MLGLSAHLLARALSPSVPTEDDGASYEHRIVDDRVRRVMLSQSPTEVVNVAVTPRLSANCSVDRAHSDALNKKPRPLAIGRWASTGTRVENLDQATASRTTRGAGSIGARRRDVHRYGCSRALSTSVPARDGVLVQARGHVVVLERCERGLQPCQARDPRAVTIDV